MLSSGSIMFQVRSLKGFDQVSYGGMRSWNRISGCSRFYTARAQIDDSIVVDVRKS